MNARKLIATTVLALSTTAPAMAVANPATQHGDGTSHVFSVAIKDVQATRQTVKNEYQKALQAGEISRVAGDASALQEITVSSATRAEVLSKIKGVDLSEGDAS